LQLLDCPAHREVIDKNPALLDGTLGHATDFSKFQIAQVLNTKPDSAAQNHKSDSDRPTAFGSCK